MDPKQARARYIAQCQMKTFYKLWLRWRRDPLPMVRRHGLLAKTFGLVYHDRTIDRLGG